jgi:hypothetical protein
MLVLVVFAISTARQSSTKIEKVKNRVTADALKKGVRPIPSGKSGLKKFVKTGVN